MAFEIEYKFLVDTTLWQRPEGGIRMRQGYVATKDGTTVRVRTAEIELPAEDTPFARPAWLGADVSDDHRYKNNNLARKPYSTWDN